METPKMSSDLMEGLFPLVIWWRTCSHWPFGHCIIPGITLAISTMGEQQARVGAKIAWGLGKLTRAGGEGQWPGAGGPRGWGKFHSCAGQCQGP